MTITPLKSEVTYYGEQVVLTADCMGWHDFIWSLEPIKPEENANYGLEVISGVVLSGPYGFLSSSSGKSVIYTVTRLPTYTSGSEKIDHVQTIYARTRNKSEPSDEPHSAGAARIIHMARLVENNWETNGSPTVRPTVNNP